MVLLSILIFLYTILHPILLIRRKKNFFFLILFFIFIPKLAGIIHSNVADCPSLTCKSSNGFSKYGTLCINFGSSIIDAFLPPGSRGVTINVNRVFAFPTEFSATASY